MTLDKAHASRIYGNGFLKTNMKGSVTCSKHNYRLKLQFF